MSEQRRKCMHFSFGCLVSRVCFLFSISYLQPYQFGLLRNWKANCFRTWLLLIWLVRRASPWQPQEQLWAGSWGCVWGDMCGCGGHTATESGTWQHRCRPRMVLWVCHCRRHNNCKENPLSMQALVRQKGGMECIEFCRESHGYAVWSWIEIVSLKNLKFNSYLISSLLPLHSLRT